MKDNQTQITESDQVDIQPAIDENVIEKEDEDEPLEVLEGLEIEIDKARVELERVKVELEEKKKDLNRLPMRDISEEETVIVKKQVAMTSERRALKEKIERQQAYDKMMVTGKFMNLRAPGQKAKLPYFKYADDSEKWWVFHHGKTYTIPRGFSDQINGGGEKDPCYYTPQFIQKEGPMDPDNPESQVHQVLTHNKRYAFVPLNF
jgi:hypothetical protein